MLGFGANSVQDFFVSQRLPVRCHSCPKGREAEKAWVGAVPGWVIIPDNPLKRPFIGFIMGSLSPSSPSWYRQVRVQG